MEEISTIDFNSSFDWIQRKICWNKELWDIKHVMDATWSTHHIVDDHYKETYLRKFVS